MGRTEYKLVEAGNIAAHLKPGRHLCHCQARVHALVRNCLGCGRIVCAQEGSGPCFHCGRLVCTREERKIIEKKDKQSLALLRKLWNDPNIASVDSVDIDLSNPANVSSLSALSKGIEAANVYKQKLLRADKDREVTKVNDLQEDYYTLEHNPYLTQQEREAIVRRKEELRQLGLQAKKSILVDVDVASGAMKEQQREPIETVHDPVIRSILVNSAARNQMEAMTAEGPSEEAEAPTLIDTFRPKYEELGRKDRLEGEDDRMRIRSARPKLYCVALKQPFASELLSQSAEEGIRFIPWRHYVAHRGPILISALGDDDPVELFNSDHLHTTKKDGKSAAEVPTGTILGMGHLHDCITWDEFNHEHSSLPSFRPLTNSFVMLITDVEPLPSPIPYAFPSEFFELDRPMVDAINVVAGGAALFEAMDSTFVLAE